MKIYLPICLFIFGSTRGSINMSRATHQATNPRKKWKPPKSGWKSCQQKEITLSTVNLNVEWVAAESPVCCV